MTRIASVSLNPVLTCAGSAGLVTGPAFVFLRVVVEAVIAAPLAPVPLQTGEGVESMWHRDTLSQSCDTTKRESSPSYSQVRSSNPQHATTSPHQTESVNAAFRKLLTTQYVVFCLFVFQTALCFPVLIMQNPKLFSLIWVTGERQSYKVATVAWSIYTGSISILIGGSRVYRGVNSSIIREFVSPCAWFAFCADAV